MRQEATPHFTAAGSGLDRRLERSRRDPYGRDFDHLTRGPEVTRDHPEQPPPPRPRDRFRHGSVPDLTIVPATTRSPGSARTYTAPDDRNRPRAEHGTGTGVSPAWDEREVCAWVPAVVLLGVDAGVSAHARV